MVASRYVKRRSTKRTGSRLRRAAALHHSDKIGRALDRAKVPPRSERTARYERRANVGRRRTGGKKGFDFAKSLKEWGNIDVLKWLRVDPAKRRKRR